MNLGAPIVICATVGIKDDAPATGPRVTRRITDTRARREGLLILDHLDHLNHAEAARADPTP